MAARRKLFIAHASELAFRCVRAVSGGGLVSEFVRSYADSYNRRALSLNPERNREFDATIGREALLVMAARVRRMSPGAFADAALADAFFAEFLASLGRSLEWPPAEAAAEAAAFHRDLQIYQRWSERRGPLSGRLSSGPAAHRYSADDPWQSPFPDRCALLLDPAMMEQARRASAEFEIEIARAAARMFSQLGRRKGEERPAIRVRKMHSRTPRSKQTRRRRSVQHRRRLQALRRKTVHRASKRRATARRPFAFRRKRPRASSRHIARRSRARKSGRTGRRRKPR